MAASKAPTDPDPRRIAWANEWVLGAEHMAGLEDWVEATTGRWFLGTAGFGQIRRPGEEDRLNTSKAITLRGETAATSGARIRLVIRGLRIITRLAD